MKQADTEAYSCERCAAALTENHGPFGHYHFLCADCREKFDGTKLTKENIKSAARIVFAIAEVIRDAKQIPAGILYVHVAQFLDLGQFETIITTLISAGLVKRHPSHMLEWIDGRSN